MGEVRSVIRGLAAIGSWFAPCWLAALSFSLPTPRVYADELPRNAATARGAPVAAEVRSPEPKHSSPAVDRASTSGLGIGGGLGSDNAGLGGHVIYYAQLPHPKLRVAVHVGAGALPWGDGYVQWGVRGGSFLAYGKRHRLVLGVMGGTVDWQSFRLHYQVLESRPIFGVGVGVGYEFMTASGFYLRATIGPALEVIPRVPFRDRSTDLIWRGNLLTVGYKLW
ncbi:MAG TPA: hypothetical protein VI299_20000 [Polyangiales bacterium]